LEPNARIHGRADPTVVQHPHGPHPHALGRTQRWRCHSDAAPTTGWVNTWPRIGKRSPLRDGSHGDAAAKTEEREHQLCDWRFLAVGGVRGRQRVGNTSPAVGQRRAAPKERLTMSSAMILRLVTLPYVVVSLLLTKGRCNDGNHRLTKETQDRRAPSTPGFRGVILRCPHMTGPVPALSSPSTPLRRHPGPRTGGGIPGDSSGAGSREVWTQ